MTTSLPTSAQLHVADQDGKYIFVHPETNFDQVIDTASGKKLKEYLAELGPGGRVEINKFPFSLTAAVNGQTEFEFADTNYDPLTSYITVHLNGEFLHPIEEYNVVKEVGKNPKVILEVGVPAGNRIHIVIERGIIVDGEDTPTEPELPTYPPFSNGYIPTGKKYGVSIDRNEASPSSRIQYIEDAVGMVPAKMNYTTGVFDYGSWKDIWFVKDNYPVMLNANGTEAYKLNPDDYTKKLDGTASDIAATTHSMNAMSCIPKVFIKQWEDATHEYILVSDVKHDDTWNAFAHTDNNGVVKDSLYISIYKSTLLSGKHRSLSGTQLSLNLDSTQEKNYATANSAGWDLRSWSQRNLINSLLTIMSKTDDAQTAFGMGNVTNQGRLATGTLNTNKQFYGSNNQYVQVKVFHIEGWWGDVFDRINGLISNRGNVQVKMTGPYNFTGTDFTPTGIIKTATEYGYVRDTQSSQFGRLPKTLTGGSNATYIPDQSYIYKDAVYVAIVGGHWTSALFAGPYYIDLSAPADRTWTNMGSGLSWV